MKNIIDKHFITLVNTNIIQQAKELITSAEEKR